ncbi:U2-type spliceosomal complex subunit CWC21 PWA37_000114 [Arxiozyma heterogenica]|uniref:U2-type spliceosomal complex subunit CWC21 n=1 Tax=Arxiozyma heterogenica TaxID=278026 RepID=UPI002F014F31
MSYNGIGLKSAKGSSTSGHIQKSLASNDERISLLNYKARKLQKQRNTVKEDNDNNRIKKISQLKTTKNGNFIKQIHNSMAKHLSKREIELRVSELRDCLEDGRESNSKKTKLTDSEIDQRCNALREELVKEKQERVQLLNRYRSRKNRLDQQIDKDGGFR